MGSLVNINKGSEQKIELSKQEIEQIFLENVSKIQENYPLVNVIRLFKGNINFNISFDNLKYVNTNFSKPEADVAINIIKEIFDEFIFEFNEENKITRTIKNTYKSKLYGFKQELLPQFIITLQEICRENNKKNCDTLENIEKKDLSEQLTQFEEFLPDIITKEKFLEKLEEKQDNLEKKGFNIDKIKKIFGHLKVNLSVKENKAENFEDKMLHIYEIEFDSIINSSILKYALEKDSDLLNSLKNKNTPLLEKAKLVAEKILEIEEKIEEKSKEIGLELSYSKNPELFFKTLETVKKGYSTGNKELDKLFENYKAIISAFNIISPITKEVDYVQLKEKAEEQNESIKDYRILINIKRGEKTEDELIKDEKKKFNFLSETNEKYNETIKSFFKKNKKISFKNKKEETEEDKKNKILHKKLNIYNEIKELTKETYKGFLTRNALAEEISGKKGTLMFIDIAGMGMSNIKENRQIIKDILNTELNPKEKEKRLLEAGLSMTKKLIEIADELKYLGAKISLGGDEFFVFIPEKSEKKLNKDTIAKIFQEKKVKARTTYLKIDKPIKIDEENDASLFEKNDSDEKKLIKKIFSIFDKLDHISEINKNIENSGKFFVPGKKDKEDFHFSFETQKNYEKKVKKILKENKKLFSKNNNSKTKENKIINFFEVSLDDLIGEKEQIIKNLKQKVSYILDENYFDVSKKNNFIME